MIRRVYIILYIVRIHIGIFFISQGVVIIAAIIWIIMITKITIITFSIATCATAVSFTAPIKRITL